MRKKERTRDQKPATRNSARLFRRARALMPGGVSSPVRSFASVGGDWHAIVLCLINITISALIYWPFFRAYDRQMVKRESESLES